MKFDSLIEHITGEKQDSVFLEGAPTKLGKLGDTLKLSADNLDNFAERYEKIANDYYNSKGSTYLLDFNDEKGLPVSPSTTIALVVDKLLKEHGDDPIYTSDWMPIDEIKNKEGQVKRQVVWKQSVLAKQVKEAIEELSGKSVTNTTQLGHTTSSLGLKALGRADLVVVSSFSFGSTE